MFSTSWLARVVGSITLKIFIRSRMVFLEAVGETEYSQACGSKVLEWFWQSRFLGYHGLEQVPA